MDYNPNISINPSGDVLLSSGSIAYLGSFTPEFRNQQASSWVETCRERGVPCSPQFDLASVSLELCINKYTNS